MNRVLSLLRALIFLSFSVGAAHAQLYTSTINTASISEEECDAGSQAFQAFFNTSPDHQALFPFSNCVHIIDLDPANRRAVSVPTGQMVFRFFVRLVEPTRSAPNYKTPSPKTLHAT